MPSITGAIQLIISLVGLFVVGKWLYGKVRAQRVLS